MVDYSSVTQKPLYQYFMYEINFVLALTCIFDEDYSTFSHIKIISITLVIGISVTSPSLIAGTAPRERVFVHFRPEVTCHRPVSILVPPMFLVPPHVCCQHFSSPIGSSYYPGGEDFSCYQWMFYMDIKLFKFCYTLPIKLNFYHPFCATIINWAALVIMNAVKFKTLV